jgi:hypothetical protein
MILAWSALLSSSVLWRTLRWELTADMILHKKTNKILQKNNPKKICLLGHGKIGQNNDSSKDFCKNKDRKYHNLVLKSSTTNNPNMADISYS